MMDLVLSNKHKPAGNSLLVSVLIVFVAVTACVLATASEAEAQTNIDCDPITGICNNDPWNQFPVWDPVEGSVTGGPFHGPFEGELREEARNDLCGSGGSLNCRIISEDTPTPGSEIGTCAQVGDLDGDGFGIDGTIYGCGDMQGTDQWQEYYIRDFLVGYFRIR